MTSNSNLKGISSDSSRCTSPGSTFAPSLCEGSISIGRKNEMFDSGEFEGEEAYKREEKLQDRVKELKQKNTHLEQELERYKTAITLTIKEGDGRILQLEEEKKISEERISISEREKEELEQGIAYLNIKLEKLQKTNRDIEEEHEKCILELEETKRVAEKLRTELEGKILECAYLKKEKAELKKTNEEIAEEGDIRVNELTKEKEILEKKVKKLEAELAEKMKELKKNQDIEQLKLSVETLKQELDSKIKNIKSKLKDKESEILSANRENEELQKELRQSKNALHVLEEKYKRLQSELEESKVFRDGLTQQKQLLAQELAKMNQLNERCLENRDLTRRFSRLEERKQECDEQLCEVQREVNILSSKLNAKDREFAELQKDEEDQLKNKNEEINRIKDEQDSLSNLVQTKQDETNVKEKELSETKAKMETLTNQVNSLTKDRNDLDSQVKELKKSLFDEQNKVNQLKGEKSAEEKNLAEHQNGKEKFSIQLNKNDNKLTQKDKIIKQLRQNNLSRNRSMCIAVGITVGLIIGAVLICATGLHMLVVGSVAVVSALVINGIWYVASKPCGEVYKVDCSSVHGGEFCAISYD